MRGFIPGSVNSNQLHIFYGGGKILETSIHSVSTDGFKEVAIKVVDGGDGKFDSSDKIIFHGEALSRFLSDNSSSAPVYQNYLYADKGENAYWLKISGTIPPKRMGTTGETPSSKTIKSVYREMIHLEQEVYIELLDTHDIESGINWYWDTIYGNIKQYSFNAPGRVDSDSTIVRFGFYNGLSKLSSGSSEYLQSYISHELGLKVNNGSTYEKKINTAFTNTMEIVLHDNIKTSGNIISIWRKNYSDYENIRLNWIEIDYEKELKLSGNHLEFFLKGSGLPVIYRISNVTSSNIELYDTTDSTNLMEITGSVYDSNSQTLSFQLLIPEGKFHRFTVCAKNDYLKTTVTKKKNSNLRNPNSSYDYLVISHANFMDQATKLANWRARDKFKSVAINVSDIYDEFSWGIYDPVAIRDFLKYLYDTVTDKNNMYCCFMGDTTNKYKNFSDNTLRNFVPTYTAVESNEGLTTDDFFVWFDDNRIPAYSTGRLCVNDKEAAANIVDKIIDYEKNPVNGIWHNRIVLVADDEHGFQGIIQAIDKTFTLDIESIDQGNSYENYIPKSIERKKIMMIEYPMDNNLKKPTVTEDIFSALNDGYAIFNFVGHGNNDVFTHEYVLKGSRDIERFNNAGKLPLFLFFSCSVGQFDKAENTSLAEMLSIRKNGGCISVIAASRVTENSHNVNFNKTFYQDLFSSSDNPDIRIGHAMQLAKAVHNSDDNSDRYILFGDPAQKLACPKYKINVAEIDTLHRLEKVSVSGSMDDGLTDSAYDTLFVKGFGPKILKKYTITSNIYVNYTMPGKLFYNAEIPLNGKNFTTCFVIPKDLSPSSDSLASGKDSQILLYATGKKYEASSIIDSLAIGGLYPNAPDDRTGPEIKLTFDGKTFGDGDYIKRQPVFSVSLTDSSGLNILGDRGHNMKLTIDKTEVIVLTDKFKNINSYTTGEIDHTLPALSSGEHEFEFSAFDNYNNASKLSFKGIVQSSETGDVIISKLLNYPNPMGNEGTNFTFSLNDDVKRADIKVYSQSGRLVDKMRFSASYGYNQVEWKPPVALSNGVYFYKLSVESVNGRKSSKIEKLVVMK